MAENINIAGTTSGVNIKLDNAVLDVWSKEILFKAQPNLRFLSIVNRQTELGAQPGNTIKFLKYDALTGDPALLETSTIPTDTLATSTIAIVVSEFAKAIRVGEFLLRSSFLNIMENAATQLGLHYGKSLDGLIRDALLGHKTAPSGVTYGGGNVLYSQKGGVAASRADLVAGSTFDVNLIRDAVELLATNKAPKFNGDAYICFVHPHQGRYLRADPAWINVADYADPSMIQTGEIGRIEDVRFIETTQVPYILVNTQDIYNDGVDSGDNTTIATNTATSVYRAVIVGDYAVGFAEALPVEMRDNGIQDFGRKHDIAYYGIWGVGLIETGHSCILETA